VCEWRARYAGEQRHPERCPRTEQKHEQDGEGEIASIGRNVAGGLPVVGPEEAADRDSSRVKGVGATSRGGSTRLRLCSFQLPENERTDFLLALGVAAAGLAAAGAVGERRLADG
jgi:hypothetical protein